MEGVERYKVRLLAHNEKWEKEYQQVKSQIEAVWDNNILDIQHVGSTAIYRIPAKPILDVAVLLRSIQKMDINVFIKLGYEYCGSQSDSGTYHLYVLRGENQISLRHIHCYDRTDNEFFQLVGFRDYLNTHDEAAQRYAKLKEILAFQYPEDRVAYTKGKETFIKSIYSQMR